PRSSSALTRSIAATIAERSSGVGSGVISIWVPRSRVTRRSVVHPRRDDRWGTVARRSLVAVAVLAALACPLAATASPRTSVWDQAQIDAVTAAGQLGGDATDFRPDDPLTAGDLTDLIAGLTGKPAVPPADPSATVTIAQLDAALVPGEG